MKNQGTKVSAGNIPNLRSKVAKKVVKVSFHVKKKEKAITKVAHIHLNTYGSQY